MTESKTPDADCSDDIIAALERARAAQQPVYITGGNSKRRILGRDCAWNSLDVSTHRGIVEYLPEELVITARGGTPVSEIADTLADRGQGLSFEPPLFEGRASIGGTVACNLSGPARPWGGAVRDHVLGVQLINGRCQRMDFGGQVMKNVAGYDVSRLQAGALGTLGVLSEISLRVVPLPEETLALRYEMSAAEAIDTMHRRAGEPRPLTGAFWCEGQLHLRLAGAASAVQHTASLWGGEKAGSGENIWSELREMSLPFFQGDIPLWRLSISPSTPIATDQPTLIDWCGAQRWVRGDHPREEMDSLAASAGGHATLFRGGDRQSEVRPPLGAVETALQGRLKQSFDPDGILNPGRLYSWM